MRIIVTVIDGSFSVMIMSSTHRRPRVAEKTVEANCVMRQSRRIRYVLKVQMARDKAPYVCDKSKKK
jgi:hypothetical protein